MRWIVRTVQAAVLLALTGTGADPAASPDTPWRPFEGAVTVAPMGGNDEFGWVSPNEILVVHSLPHHSPGNRYSASLLRLSTRRERPLPRLTRLFNRTRGTISGSYPVSGQLSPDGSRVLWVTGKGPRWDQDYRAATSRLDGTEFHLCQIGEGLGVDAKIPNPVLWLPDSEHWIELSPDDPTSPRASGRGFFRGPYPFGRVRRAGSSKLIKVLPLPDPIDDDLYLLPARGRLFRATQPLERLDLDEYPIGKRIGPPIHHPFSWPRIQLVWRYSVAPAGDRAAWAASFQVPARPPQDPPAWREVEGLLVGDLATGEIREVGRFGPKQSAGSLQWSPDGRSLAFISRGHLWTFPVEDPPAAGG